MNLSISTSELPGYVARQFSNYFPDDTVNGAQLKRYVDLALERTEYCFGHIKHKYFSRNGEPYFNHLHTDQYSMFLYFLSNSIHRLSGDEALASKAYALNKVLNAIDVFYEVELPDIFFMEHPLGTVLGRAKYSNYLCVYQRVNVGGSVDEVYPRLGEGVILHGGSAIIGDSTVGDNCWLSVGAVVMDQDIPSNSVVFGRSPDAVIKPTRRNVMEQMFKDVPVT
jgi:serine O-acetyltransferase